jgi:hypothetical protein
MFVVFFPSPLCQLTLFTQPQPTVATQFNIFLLACLKKYAA